MLSPMVITAAVVFGAIGNSKMPRVDPTAAPPLPHRLPTPPAGWRSWNQLGGGISQAIMLEMARGMASKARTVDGVPTSLVDLGYNRIGMDDNWQACGAGTNGSFHNATGWPLWNTTRFPNVAGMNAGIHALGLKSDWYINNCICGEKAAVPPGFVLPGNARALVELGFDGTKMDGCGPDRNVTLFAKLVDEAAQAQAANVGGGATARPIVIEDCNDDPGWDRGVIPGDDRHGAYPAGGCSVSGGGYYRIGGDIKADWTTMVMAAQGMAGHLQHSQWHTMQTRPGCWGTPDALEVGCTRQGALGMNFTEARSHFGFWVITSSPLVLGLDLRDSAAVDFAWPIITNRAALRVNRAWPLGPDGSGPGRLVATDGVWSAGRIENITRQVWAKNVSATEVAVLLVNVGDTPQTISVGFDAAATPAMVPMPCSRASCAPGIPGWDPLQPTFRWYCRPCMRTSAVGNGAGPARRATAVPTMTARNLWTGAALPPVDDAVLSVGPLQGHDSVLVLLTLATEDTSIWPALDP